MKIENGFQKTATLVVLFLAAYLGRPAPIHAENYTVDYNRFKDPLAEYRGICWMGFNLSNPTEDGIVARVQSSAKSGFWGSLMLGPGGGPTTGLSKAYLRGSRRKPSAQGVVYLSEEYFRFYRLAIGEGLRNNFPLRVRAPEGCGSQARQHTLSLLQVPSL